MRPVAITGIGVLSPIGNAPGLLLQSINQAKSLLRHTGLADPDRFIGAVDTNFPDIPPRQARRLDRFSLLALQAAIDAVGDARLGSPLKKQSGVFWGTGFGGVQSLLEQASILEKRGARRVSPFLVPATIANAAAGHIAQRFEILGPSLTYTSACASSAMAIGEAYLQVANGDIEIAIAGGSEAALHPLAVAGFGNAKALAPPDQLPMPFGTGRSGFCLAEAGVALVLEPLNTALNRRTTIYAQIAGYGTSSDAYHITNPDPVGKGAERAVRIALKSSGVEVDDIGYVNAHATGTDVGDRAEATMLRRVFNLDSSINKSNIKVSSTKGLTGHALGAAGALEVAITALTIQSGLLPQNVGALQAADDCQLPLVAHTNQQNYVGAALCNSFGFGGVNVALVLTAAELGVEKK